MAHTWLRWSIVGALAAALACTSDSPRPTLAPGTTKSALAEASEWSEYRVEGRAARLRRDRSRLIVLAPTSAALDSVRAVMRRAGIGIASERSMMGSARGTRLSPASVAATDRAWQIGQADVLSISLWYSDPYYAGKDFVSSGLQRARGGGRGGRGTVAVFIVEIPSNRRGGDIKPVAYPGRLSCVLGVTAMDKSGAVSN